ncbi:MAG: hypothetical protein M3N46_01470, partial [Actinomycetota bacterium]|nr:hypothetical protein [Actinomycetota bacterium]
YDASGAVKGKWSASGHSDGLRMDPVNHVLWAMSNEDGNPVLTVIDPASGKSKVYKFASTSHGGGYDDIAFMNGAVYLSASNPKAPNGTNTKPAVVSVTLDDAAGTANVKPILAGDAKAGDGNGGTTTLNMIDPDSMFVSAAGDLVVDNQAGTALVTIHNPGPNQVVTQQVVGTQVDDTVITPKSSGRLLVSDTTGNTVYAVRDTNNQGNTYVATPNDSGVAAFVGTLTITAGNPATIRPIVIGFASPHGMGFLAGN